jgi:hypothetical protein
MPFFHQHHDHAHHFHMPHIGMRKVKSILAIFVGFWLWQGLRLLIPGVLAVVILAGAMGLRSWLGYNPQYQASASFTVQMKNPFYSTQQYYNSSVAEQMAKQRSLWLKTELGEEKVSVSDVLYMEAQNQNIMISTKTGSYCVRYNMADYETELEADGFFRIHRGYLISLGHVKSIGKNEVTMDDSTVLPVSRSKDKALKEALFQYIRKEAI